MLTPKEMAERFVERDNNAMNDLQWRGAPYSESERLRFLESRVTDLAAITVILLKMLDDRYVQNVP